MGWKTITGALATAFGYVSDPSVLNLLPHKIAAVVTAAGGILAAIGIRHAVKKAS